MSIVNQRIVIDEPDKLISACDDFCFDLRSLEQQLDRHGQIELLFAEGLMQDLSVISAVLGKEIQRAHEEKRKYDEMQKQQECSNVEN